MKLPDWHERFLGLTNQDLGFVSNDIQGVVYGPGLVCMRCKVDLSTGVVVERGQILELLGQDCAFGYAPGKWLNAMDIGKYYLSHQQLLADQALKPGLRSALRGLELRLQLEPGNKFVCGMRNMLMDGKTLSEEQVSAVERNIAEMGGLKAMLGARDQLRRLSILGSLQALSPEDEGKVSSLMSRLLRPEYLSTKQDRMIFALQDKYSTEVLAYTSQLLYTWPPVGGCLWKID